jgi:hypothetical protein
MLYFLQFPCYLFQLCESDTKTNACEESVNDGLEPPYQENTMDSRMVCGTDLGPIACEYFTEIKEV